MVDALLSFFLIRRNKSLVDREPSKVKPVDKRAALQTLEIFFRLTFHLDVKNIHTVKTHLAGKIDTLIHPQLRILLESPERIRRNRNGIRTR